MTFALAGIGGFGLKYLATFVQFSPPRFRILLVLAGEAIVDFFVLFFAGLAAWKREQAKNESQWPDINQDQREKLVELIRPFASNDAVPITLNDTPDCKTLAANMTYILNLANWKPVHPKIEEIWWPSGLVISARTKPKVDDRALVFQDAIRSIVKIAPVIESSGDGRLHIVIGCKPRA